MGSLQSNMALLDWLVLNNSLKKFFKKSEK
jgi:hypothetical protein